jgi:hypothetical protein
VTLDPSLLVFLQDTVTIEPFVSYSQSQGATYGAAVTYQAMVMPWVGREITSHDGKQFTPAARFAIPGRVSIDPRSRATLPSDMLIAGTRTPPIRVVRPGPASTLNLDYTELIF